MTTRELAEQAIEPWLTSNMNRELLTNEWAQWFEKNEINDPQQARELVEATLRERISGLVVASRKT